MQPSGIIAFADFATYIESRLKEARPWSEQEAAIAGVNKPRARCTSNPSDDALPLQDTLHPGNGTG
jgi:hypothetical protein